MKMLFCTSEAAPFAVSGGLGEVSSALPTALRQRFVGSRVVLPLYDTIAKNFKDEMQFIASFSVPVSWRRQYCGVFELRKNGVTYYFLDNQYYFKRDGMYGYYDDAERYAFFSRAVLEMLPYLNYYPDVLHCNDWQTALIPVYQKLYYASRPGYGSMKTVLTIHNVQYQGRYGEEILEEVFGIGREHLSLLEYGGDVNMLKGGIESADRVTTVSPTYAEELLDPWYAYGMDPILSLRREKLCGIVNGIDTDVYDPAGDPDIAAPYSAEAPEGKAVCKAALQRQLGLAERPDVPVVAMVSRLVAGKGIDLVKYAFDRIMERDLQLVVLGSGDWIFESFFDEMAARYPDKFRIILGFYPALSHSIYAGSDLFLMPSKTEPCGLAQMIALRYGTVPIVRETGGLRDTVRDCGGKDGNGFTFQTFNADDMLTALSRGLDAFADKPRFAELQKRAMECDNSWKHSAGEYLKLYRGLTGKS